MILAAIPYCPATEGAVPEPGKDFGYAINQFFDRLRDDDWGLVLDHDLMFTTRDWYRRLERAVAKYPDAGFFTLMRAPASEVTRYSEPKGIDSGSNDMAYHWKFGKRWSAETEGQIDDITGQDCTAGIFLMSKRVWTQVGGFDSGFKAEFIDYKMHKKVVAAGLRAYLIRDVYLFHGKRFR